MQELKNEQTEVVNQLDESTKNQEEVLESAKQEEATTEVSLGKFKDINTLLSAYNSLQAEFTKRCQRLKELETAIEKTDKVYNSQNQSAEEEQVKLTDTTLKEEILKDYLKEIISSKKPVVMDGVGVGIKAPVKRPTTIEQAGDLFKELLSEKSN